MPHGTAGEVIVRGPNVLYEYWGDADATAEALRDGWYHTGDIGTRDADGYFYIHDRKKNMIISGGENIYPSEVEAALGAHPMIKDVAIVGTPDEKWGERVHAFVILHDEATATSDELIAWCRDRIAPYKRPRSMSFIREEDMPRTATGKILHRVLRARLVE